MSRRVLCCILVKIVLYFCLSSNAHLVIQQNQNESEEKTHLEIASCVMHIVRGKLVNSERKVVVFLSEDESESKLWEEIVSKTDEQHLIVSAKQTLTNYEKLVYVFFAKVGQTFHDILANADKNSYFIGIADDTYTRDQLFNLFKQLFDAKIEDVLIMMPTEKKIHLYTSYPYSETHCNQCGPPILVNTFANGNFSKKYNLFPFKKYWNLYGCEVKCIGNRQPPDALMVVDKNGEITFTKLTKEILTMFSYKLNFKPKVVTGVSPPNNSSLQHSWFFYNDSIDLITDHLENELVDFAIGHFSWLAFPVNTKLRFGKESRIECYTWAVPKRAGKKRSYIMSYINEFDFLSWILFGNILVFTFFVLWIIHLVLRQNKPYRDAASIVSYIIATVLNQPAFIKPRSMSLRVFLCHWFAYVLVITTAYQATLWSFLTIPWQVDDIHTIQDLAESPLKFSGGPQMLNILKRIKINNNIEKIIEKFNILPPTSFHEVIDRIERDRDIAVFGEKQHMEFYSVVFSNENPTHKVHYLEDCLIQTFATPFLVKTGSPLYKPMNEALKDFLQTGFMKKLKLHFESNFTPVVHHDTKVKTQSCLPISMKNFKGIFFILILGYVLATVIFLLEMLLKRIERRSNVLIISGLKMFK